MAMLPATNQDYLYHEVMTATPNKLHLMLIEAAIRFAQRARHARDEARNEDAGELLIRSQEVVAQLVAGLDAEQAPDLVRRMRGVYMFVYRSLLAAQLAWSDRRVDEALEVLAVERETWQLLVQQSSGQRATADQRGATGQHLTGPHVAPSLVVDATPPAAGFSIEA